MSAADRPVSPNPFSARRIRPGALAYLFPEGHSAERLVERLEAQGGWGQIVGPHGSGKSTLLAALIPALERSGRPCALVELHDGARSLPGGLARLASLGRGAVVIVDGYEQLSSWSRWRLKRYCRAQGLGLLVTAHRAVGLPLLFRTETSPELAGKLVAQLSPGCASWISPQELQRYHASHQGNVRELLFDLYDRYERRSAGDDRGDDADKGGGS